MRWRQESTNCPPSITSRRPGNCGIPIHWWTVGHFNSQSISNVDLPKLRARTYARLAATTDFPSPFIALVMTVTLPPSIHFTYTTLFRPPRNLMASLEIVPSDYTTGESQRLGVLT